MNYPKKVAVGSSTNGKWNKKVMVLALALKWLPTTLCAPILSPDLLVVHLAFVPMMLIAKAALLPLSSSTVKTTELLVDQLG